MFKRRKLGKAGTRPTGTELLVDNKCVIDRKESSGETEGPVEDPPSEPAEQSGSADAEPVASNEPDSASTEPKKEKIPDPKPNQPALYSGDVPIQTHSPRRKTPTIIHDLQPNICKEYHKTGYCSYGDSCKFAHIRDLHPAKQPANPAKLQEKVEDPTCLICHKDPVQPAKAKCGHRFCLQCFLSTKPKTCPACNAETNGSVSVER